MDKYDPSRMAGGLLKPRELKQVKLPKVLEKDEEIIVISKVLGAVKLVSSDADEARVENTTDGFLPFVLIVAPPGFQKFKSVPWGDIARGVGKAVNWFRNRKG